MKNLFFLWLLLPQISVAQLNKSDSLGLRTKLTLTGFWQEGNAEVLVFRGKANVSIGTGQWVFKTQNAYLYQEFFRQKADEDIFSRNFVYFSPKHRIYPFMLGFVATNFRRQINLRYFVGAGLTWQIIRRKAQTLKLALSGEYEQSNFAQDKFNQPIFNGKSTITTWRATVWLLGKFKLSKHLSWHYESYVQPSLIHAGNMRWQLETGLETPLWRFVSLRVNYLYMYEKLVVVNERPQDSFLTFGVNIQLF
ncbi:DUF481 domain-containing protein [uncultured Microscilla sp.]|uniref:DUF481 domain-containing protein n=1 Tax=uncultured Microscilla sp. TaxID=432653 RepID=UPI00262221D3|nr:DUF481 domain-containing protein [uncultured Microscilla sp.]